MITNVSVSISYQPNNNKDIVTVIVIIIIFRSTLNTNSTTSTMAPIGFIGLGIMGEGMAGCLLKEGIAGSSDVPLIVWNRTTSKCTELKERFPDKIIEIKDSAEEVVKACGITFSMLSTPEASRAVFEAEHGTLAGVGGGKSIVDCATLAESDMKRMDEQVKSKGG